MKSEQVKGEVFKPTERIKVYILEVKNTPKGPRILVSRTHPELVKRLFESEVTEIKDGTVEIRALPGKPEAVRRWLYIQQSQRGCGWRLCRYVDRSQGKCHCR